MSDTVAVSVVVPVFNEAPHILPLTEEIIAVMEPLGRPYEILYVDDGSTDAGAQQMQDLAATRERFRTIRLDRNSGQSAALAAGIQAARGDVIVTLDGDRQNDPRDIPAVIALLDSADLVCGYRRHRQDTWVRLLSSRIAYRIRNAVLHDNMRDTGCSLKAFSRTAALTLPRFHGMHRFLPALFLMAGYRVTETPVSHRPRTAGTSKYGIYSRLWKGVVDLWAVGWLRRNWIRPDAGREPPP